MVQHQPYSRGRYDELFRALAEIRTILSRNAWNADALPADH